jgi:hypothetical protein
MLFKDVYPGFDLDTNLIYKEGLLIKIKIQLIDTKTNTEYVYKLVQDTPNKAKMLDSYNNCLSELDLKISELSESLVKIITAILISSLEQQRNKIEMFMRPHFKAPKKNSSTPVTPAQIKLAYNLPSTSPYSKPPVITLINVYDKSFTNSNNNQIKQITNDLKLFCATHSLTVPNKDINVYSLWKTGNAGSNGWYIETTLDVQGAYSMNQNAIIQVVLAASNSYNDLHH